MKVIVETLKYDDYVTYDNHRSEIDETKFIKRFVSFMCPYCKLTSYRRLQPFCSHICTNCGLESIRNGDKIDCKLIKY